MLTRYRPMALGSSAAEPRTESKTNARAMKVYEAMGMDGAHYTVYERMKN